MIDKRGEIVEIIYNWQASPYSEKVLADRLMEWHEREIAPLRKVWGNLSENDIIYLPTPLKEAIQQVLGETEEGGEG